jgi:hypothetical protein
MPPIPKHSIRFIVVAASWFVARAETSPSMAAFVSNDCFSARPLRRRCLTDFYSRRIRPRVDHYKGLDEPATWQRLDRLSQSQLD